MKTQNNKEELAINIHDTISWLGHLCIGAGLSQVLHITLTFWVWLLLGFVLSLLASFVFGFLISFWNLDRDLE